MVLQVDNPTSPRRVWFFHHTFHDYALSRWIGRLASGAILNQMADVSRALMLRPALRLIWRTWWERDRTSFWQVWRTMVRGEVATGVSSDDRTGKGPIPTFIRLLPAQALLEAANTIEDLGPLGQSGEWTEPERGWAMRDVLQVRRSVRQAGEEASGRRNPSPSTTTSADVFWLAWVRANPLLEPTLHLTLELLEDATRPDSPLREQAFPIAVEVSSQIYDRYCSSGESPAISYRREVTRLLARCAVANLALAEPRLRAEAALHHQGVGLWTAQEIEGIIDTSPTLGADVMLAYFAYEEQDRSLIGMGPPSMPMSTFANQSYEAVLYDFARRGLPLLLQADISEGVRCITGIVESIEQRESADLPSWRQEIRSAEFQEGTAVDELTDESSVEVYQNESTGEQLRFRPSRNGLLMDNLGRDWKGEVLKVFREWFRALSDDNLSTAFTALRVYNERAYLWRVCLDVAANAPAFRFATRCRGCHQFARAFDPA